MEEGQIQIHTENIFPIIKKAVYSDHEVFLRELVSNSVDAIKKRKMAALSGDCEGNESGKINITINRDNKTLIISDNGIGMTLEEIKKYINQVAFSSAEEFLEKYKQEDNAIIGHFGLGFYSSFMVSSKVELVTKSAVKDSKSYIWSCDGSPSFRINDANKDSSGTDVILYLLEEELEFIEPARIRNLITKYCDFMPVEVCLEGEVINKKDPLWRKNKKDTSDKDYIELYKYLYPFQGDPLLWIHLNTDFPYSLQGILYFPKIVGRADWENGEIKLYCNQVYVSDSIKEVVPKYLLPLRGVIDSPDIPLNVSRSALQADRKVKSIGSFISKKIADKLNSIKKENPSFYAEIWESIAPFVKIGSMEDEKFATQTENIILFETTNDIVDAENTEKAKAFKYKNKTYTTIEEYKKRSKPEYSDKIIYFTDEISQASALKLWKSRNIEIIKADTVIDSQFIPWIESKKKDITFQRVDSEIEEQKEKEIELADKDGETQSEYIRSLIKKYLNNDNITVQVKHLKSDDAPPAMILLPEQMRRINDLGALMEQRLPSLPDNHILLINASHPIIDGLLKISKPKILLKAEDDTPTSPITSKLISHIYDMARLGVGGLKSSEIEGFQNLTNSLILQLMKND